MPTLDQHSSFDIVKLLIEGDSGTGKTGALVSLLLAGYRIFGLDFDNGFDIIKNILLEKKRRDLLSKVDVHVLTDAMHASGVHLVPREATAWPRMVQLMGAWPDLGGPGKPAPVSSLGKKDILVLDSLNFAGRAAMRYVAKLNNRLTVPPQIQDFYDAQRMIENLCATLYDDALKCNVIVLTHLREVSQKKEHLNDKGRLIQVKVEGSERMLPETGAGTAMSPVIGRFFNNVLLTDIVGSGAGTRRIIRTRPHGNIGLKTSAPGSMPAELPLDTGLATFFALVKGEADPAAAQQK